MIPFEVCCDTLESCMNAARGGAKRIELCCALKLGGLTPSVGLLAKVGNELKNHGFPGVKIYVLIRPRDGDFIYSKEEVDLMEIDIALASQYGASGAVFGCLTKTGSVDVPSTERLVSKCKELKLDMTFHRAFDYCTDLHQALGEICDLGIGRVLSAGGAASVVAGSEKLKALVNKVDQNAMPIRIMAGGGVSCKNAKDIVAKTGCHELHGSLKTIRKTTRDGGKVSEEVCEEFSSWWVTDLGQVQEMIAHLEKL